MKMIPGIMRNEKDGKISGESLVFNMLENLDLNGYALHSVWQMNQKGRVVGEVDFLVICEFGVICVEVKGGIITREAGQWMSMDVNKISHPIKDPFVQARECMFAAQDHVNKNFPDMLANGADTACLFGSCVVFPDCEFYGDGIDIERKILFDAQKFDTRRGEDRGFGVFLKSVHEYWKNKLITTKGISPKLLNRDGIEKYKRIFRDDINAVPSLITNAECVEQQLLQLTKEQRKVMRDCGKNKHIIVTGAAGTGKSLLALEQLRRKIEQGENVAYICFNRSMAEVAKTTIGQIPAECFVGTYHSLFKAGLNEPGVMQKIKDICRSAAPLVQKYDYLIVDEAQDLFDADVLEESFEKILNGGLKDGRWIMFLDKKQNIFNLPDDFELADDHIHSVCNPTDILLTTNCRNARRIGETTASVTRTQHAEYLDADGGNVSVSRYKDRDEFLAEFKKRLKSLLAAKISINDIVVLSKRVLEKSLLCDIKEVYGWPLVAPGNISLAKPNHLNYYTIQSYKGLDSKIVFLVDIDGFASDRDRALNYVGMSRARAFLYMFIPEEIYDEYRELTR